MRRIGATFRRVHPPHGAAACYDGAGNCSRGVFRCRSAVFRRPLPVLPLHCCLPLRPLRRQLRGIGPGARTRVTPIRPTAKSKAAPRSSMPARRPEKNLSIAYNNRANGYADKKQYEQALADYDHSLRLDPDYAIAYRNRGLSYNAIKEYDRAITDYDRRSGSIRATPPPSTAAAARITRRKTTTARSRTIPKP